MKLQQTFPQHTKNHLLSIPVWNYALQYIVEWANKWNGINVIAGPAFDYNHDSLSDSQEDIDK